MVNLDLYRLTQKYLIEKPGREQQLPIFEKFYNLMCAEELAWIVRIILKRKLLSYIQLP